MKHSRAIATTAFLIGAISFSMPTKPLLAHAGHSSFSENKVEQPVIEEQTDNKPQIPQKDDDVSKPQNTSVKQETNITESEIVPAASPETSLLELARADVIPIMGESLFVLLLASPFLLVAFKKWFHK